MGQNISVGHRALFVILAMAMATWGTSAHAVADLPDTKAIDKALEKPVAEKDTPPSSEGMGKDIRKFGEEVAQRIDRIVKKKTFELWGDPWTMQGIPITFPSAFSGFNIGLRLQLQNIRRQDPHEAEIIAQ